MAGIPVTSQLAQELVTVLSPLTAAIEGLRPGSTRRDTGGGGADVVRGGLRLGHGQERRGGSEAGREAGQKTKG